MAATQNFSHFMLQEIHEQPDVIERCLNCPGAISSEGIDRIQILACGTSLHASYIAQSLFEQIAQIPTQVRSASEFLVAPWPERPNTLTIAVTQSGETADTLAAIAAIKSGADTRRIAITNQINSTIAQLVDTVLPTHAGEERSVAATKTFTAQLAVFYQLALHFARDRQQLSEAQWQAWSTQLRHLPTQMQQVLQQESAIAQLAQTLKTSQSLILLGSGINAPIAQEAALKLKEATYTHAEGYAAGEFLHGPIALVDEQIPIIALTAPGKASQRVFQAAQKSHTHGASVVYVHSGRTGQFETSQRETVDPRVDLRNVVVNPTQQTGLIVADLSEAPSPPEPITELLSPFLNILPCQLLAYHLAIVRGISVDRPRNIVKSLTNP